MFGRIVGGVVTGINKGETWRLILLFYIFK